MCLQKCARIFLLITIIAVIVGCGALDAILPSTGTYKINALINDTPLDDFSVVTSKDKVFPFFEDPVSDDPDITELVVFLKDSRGQVAGYKVTYSLIDKENKEDGKELQQSQDSKTDNKDDKKKDEAVKEDTSTDKKKDEVVTNTGNNTSTASDKPKETVAAVTGNSTTPNTSANTTGNSAAVNTTTNSDKPKETASASAASTSTTNTDKPKETAATGAATNTTTSAGAASTTTANTDKNKETAVAGNSAATNTTTGTDKSKETAAGAASTVTGNNTATAAGADKTKETTSEKTDKDKKETVAANTDPLELYEHTKKGNEINFPVKSLDKNLPFLPIPADLPIGRYMLVFQVKGKNTILYKSEKPLFYLSNAEFSFEGIQVHLPGIADSLQFIQNKNIILLDVHLDFDSRLEPYVVWYNGKKIIDEGRYSDGAGTLFWKAPEQNGFVSLRAEVFPSWDKSGLTGYQKGISLLVSSKEVDMHLLSKDTTNLVQWYVFEDDLNDSLTKDKDSEELAIEPAGKNKLNWMPSNGTYGLASGNDNAFKLPAVSLKNNDNENWQIVSRFKPLGEGEIYSVQFGSADVTAALNIKKSTLVLSLTSASRVYSESLKLPNEDDSFIAVSVKFIIHDGILSAKLAFVKPNEDFNNQKEPVINPISVTAEIEKDFKVILGNQQKKSADSAQTAEVKEDSAKDLSSKEPSAKDPSAKEPSAKETPDKEPVVQDPSVTKQPFTALWDEIAIIRLPAVKIINTKKNTKETKVEETAAVVNELPEAPAANNPVEEPALPE